MDVMIKIYISLLEMVVNEEMIFYEKVIRFF